MNKLIKSGLFLLAATTAALLVVFHPSPIFALESGIIKGRVTNQFGDGIAIIRVAASTARVPGPGEDFAAYTDGDGFYTITTITDLPAVNYYILASGNDIYAGKFYPNAVNPKNAKTVFVSSGSVPTYIDFQLDPGFTISGTVKDTLGNPIDNMNVIAFYEGEAPPLGFAVTNGGGGFTTNALSPGNYYVHAGDQNGYLGVFYPDASYVTGRPIPPPDAFPIKITTQNVFDYNFVLQKTDKTIIENTISNLVNLATLEPNNKRLGKTIDRVVKYLQNLISASGIGYFNTDQKAVKELLISIKTERLSDQVQFAFKETIKKLVEMARVKAQTAIQEAKSIPVRNFTKEYAVNRMIETAEGEMIKAEGFQFNESDRAIEHYGFAWKYAQKAMVLAYKN